MSCSGETHDDEDQKTIMHIPEEILEYILMKVSPYNDLKSASLVCTLWYKIVKVVLKKLQQNYILKVFESKLSWKAVKPDAGSRITERYSHCSCYFDKSVYVFGGCTATNTTLNDLWRFDLATREWIRPLAMGTYPFPKACASLVVYGDSLVLFGGWSHPTPFPLHQAARFFSELHVYKPSQNRWLHHTTLSAHSPQPMAGHSASVIQDMMVVFGGSQVPGIRTNDVWVFDFKVMEWRMPRCSITKPLPRYGQTQVSLDDQHILILGGCGGPNQIYNDVWLLTVGADEWRWEEIRVENMEWAAPQIWCHSACKVGNCVVTLSKPAKPPHTPPSSPQVTKLRNPRGRKSSREEPAHQPQHRDSNSSTGDEESENDQSDSSSSESSSLEEGQLDSPDSDEKTLNPRPGLPSVRPNAMKNRQRQLEALLKYEKKLRQSNPSVASGPQPGTSRDAQSQNVFPSRSRTNLASAMVLHVLDVSSVLERKCATWQELKFDEIAAAPDETIFYSLVEGRAELIMFGGIERDIQSLQRGHGIKTHTVNNLLYLLTPIQNTL